MQKKKAFTSWNPVHKWYDNLVQDEGHYYHKEVVLPKLLSLIQLKPKTRVLDIGSGQGILSRALPKEIEYHGLDYSKELIDSAKKRNKNPHCHFYHMDATKDLSFFKDPFDYIFIILALQNISDPFAVIKNAKKLLKPQGKLIIVLNHPCFRIPKQTHWGFEREKQMQYRKINRYLSPIKIPIQINPSQKNHSKKVFSFHHSLSDYSQYLFKNKLVIEKMEEWVSNKKSTRKYALMENRARKEFPLFLTLVASHLKKD